jgi:hypothetical protein
MSSILYYSKYCEICKKYLQILSRTQLQEQIHFICIDKRIKENSQTYIILDNGQKIILPESVVRVPALLLLNNYSILYGEQILEYLKPKQVEEVSRATQNNFEPLAFSLNFSSSNIVSDNYSFLDQSNEELSATGNGGMRQMHNYMDLNYSNNLYFNENQNNQENFNTTIRGSQKIGEENSNKIMEDRMKKLQEDRDADLKNITNNRPPF